MVEKKEEKKERWAVGEVPTETRPVLIDTTDDNPETRVYTEIMFLAKIGNDLEKLKKLLD